MFIKRSKKDIGFYFNIFFLVAFVLFLLYIALSHLYSLGTDDLGYFDLDIFYQSISGFLFMVSGAYTSFVLGLISKPVYCTKCKKTVTQKFIYRIFPGLYYISKIHQVLIIVATTYMIYFPFYFVANTHFLRDLSKDFWPLVLPIGSVLIFIFIFITGRSIDLIYQFTRCRKCDSYI